MKDSKITQTNSQFKTGKNIQRVKLDDVVISEETKKLYEYSNRENDIKALMESIIEIGQREPIIVLKEGDKFPLIDGVLRLMACVRLKVNEIDVIVTDFIPTTEFDLMDFVIHHHIRKEKTPVEKMNEIREILRIDRKDKNPLRDKEKRVQHVSTIMGGKGWKRNNVFSLEKVLNWESDTEHDLKLYEKLGSNELQIKRALDAIDLIDSNQFDVEKETKSCIVKEFLKGTYEKERAQVLMDVFDRKNSDTPTPIEIHQVKGENFELILGNAEDVVLPDDLLIDAIFTSPPYYMLRKYGDDPNELGWEKTPNEYVKRLADILMRGYDKLKDTGSMFINIGETYDDVRCLAVIDRLTLELIDRGARYIDKLIWEKKANKPMNNSNKRLKNSYEVVLHFAKTKEYHFERFKINAERSLKVARGCKEHFYDTKSVHIPNKYNSPSNFLSDEYVDNILRIQIGKDRPKYVPGETVHPATFPSTLPLIPLVISCPKSPNTVVFDPFSGTSSTGVTALKLGFKFVGIELYEKNIASARRILAESQKEFEENGICSILDECGLYKDPELDVAA